MKTKVKMLAAGVSAAVMLGLSSQASATVYAGSSLAISSLQIAIGQFNGQTIVPGGATVTNFNFNLTNTATLGANIEAATATCFGSPAANNCGASPTLDALEADLGSINRVNNATGADGTLLWYALDGGDWSNSDSVVKTAQLVNGVPTSTDQIAQSNITILESAAANAEIKSTTGFTFTFTITDTGELSLSFEADPDMIAQIVGEPDALSLANMNMSFTLEQNTGGSAFVRWAPQGTGAVNDCVAVSGATCVETADSEDLNLNVTTSANNTSATHSYDPNAAGLQRYGIFVTGLTAGTWTLGLNAVTSTLITRVPEPGILSLMGLGLLGIGVSQRRRTKTA